MRHYYVGPGIFGDPTWVQNESGVIELRGKVRYKNGRTLFQRLTDLPIYHVISFGTYLYGSTATFFSFLCSLL